jgi:predicted secreted protein
MDNKKLAITVALVVLAFLAGTYLGYVIKEAPPANTASDDNASADAHEGDHIHIYNMSANGTTLDLKKDTMLLIALPENGGSTGYLWDITSTQGIGVMGSWFLPGGKGLIGEPGTREWMIKVSRPGEQKFKATLQRSFEAPSGNESTFVLTINVIE